MRPCTQSTPHMAVSCGSHVSAECMSVGFTLCTCDPVMYTECTPNSALTRDPHDTCTQSTSHTYKGGEMQGGSRCWSPLPLPPLFRTIFGHFTIMWWCPPSHFKWSSYPPAHSAEQFKIRKDTFEQQWWLQEFLISLSYRKWRNQLNCIPVSSLLAPRSSCNLEYIVLVSSYHSGTPSSVSGYECLSIRVSLQRVCSETCKLLLSFSLPPSLPLSLPLSLARK